MVFRRIPLASLRARLGRVFSSLDLSDLIGAFGFAALLYGLSQWSVPMAWTVGGALLMGLAVAPYVRKGKV